MRIPYPRTPHLPWSPGVVTDDVRIPRLTGFEGREIVVTEKLDGENTTMYSDGLHARSLDSAHHPSRTWIKSLHARIARSIPPGWRICGENLFARHSIPYQGLESWFYAFSVWNGNQCLDWDQTVRFTRKLGIPVPRVLWRGIFDERALHTLRLDESRQEGYVVRTADAFTRDEFADRVAKWVRPNHVQTDAHWMLAPVIENGLSPTAALWDLRSGSSPDAQALLTATGIDVPEPVDLTEISTRLDVLGRTGDARLAGVLATLFHATRRAWLAPHLVAPLGMPLARRIADLVGLHTKLHDPFPDESRRSGLVRLAFATDLGILHAIAATLATTLEAREQVEWSELHTEESGLLGEAPFAALRTGLREKLGGKGDIADRCWAETREAYAMGRISTPEEGIARNWRRLSGDFPRLIVTVGPSGSGKSTFAAGRGDPIVSLDDLREARGSRSDQQANPAVYRDALRRLDTLLAGGGTVIWDATALNRRQRSVLLKAAQRRDALTTYAVMLVREDVVVQRNANRPYPVPANVLTSQLRRFGPPFPGEAHRIWYIGEEGTVLDTAGTLDGED
ncbi:RNA ligase family protein [Acrocarpospora sp. B8E8]|uniref:RNA ligase family protein n=1 Tax=Acrocarpospora sp. B8E8 TaxID=3153572 RepID=UPI00325E331D